MGKGNRTSSNDQGSSLATRPDQQARVARLGLYALANPGLRDLMDAAVRSVAESLDVQFTKILLLQPEGDVFRVKAGIGWREGYVGEATVTAATVSQAGYTLATTEPIVVTDAAQEERFELSSMLKEHGIRSGVSVVIDGEDQPCGVLGAFHTEPRSYTDEDIHFMQAVANVLAGAIERRRFEDALLESEARARAVLETTVDGIITIDEYGMVESFNPAAERIFGYSADEVIGNNIEMLMPQPYRDEHDEYLRSYRETGRRKIIGIGREVVGKRKDGSTFPLDLAVSEVHMPDRRLFTGVVRDITDRRKLEQEILRISEFERRRIGQDLHDGLGQMLTGIGLISRNLARTLEKTHPEIAQEVVEITDLIKESDEFARGLARGLVPVDLEANGLRSALGRLAGGAERLFGIRCTFEEIGSVLIHDNSIATHLYRIAQESVSNAVKHGKARHVRISLAGGNRQIRLRIQDDGVGFPEVQDEETRGMGVRSMHHRARIIGANLEIQPGVEGGTTVMCTVRDPFAPLPMGGEEYGKK